MNTTQKLVRNKIGLLNLAEELRENHALAALPHLGNGFCQTCIDGKTTPNGTSSRMEQLHLTNFSTSTADGNPYHPHSEDSADDMPRLEELDLGYTPDQPNLSQHARSLLNIMRHDASQWLESHGTAADAEASFTTPND